MAIKKVVAGIKSKERVKSLGEVFTPPHIVKAMCDMPGAKEELDKLDSLVLEPSCGNGNIVEEVVIRRLETARKFSKGPEEFSYFVIRGLSRIYAIDIAPDNVFETKERIIGLVRDAYKNLGIAWGSVSVDIQKSIRYILDRNVIHGDFLKSTMSNLDKLLTIERLNKSSDEGLGNARLLPINQTLLLTEWVFSGNHDEMVTRKIFRITALDDELNLHYRTVRYDKLYTLGKELTEDDEEVDL